MRYGGLRQEILRQIKTETSPARPYRKLTRVKDHINVRYVVKNSHLISILEPTSERTQVLNLMPVIFQVELEDCTKRFTQSSNLAAHEKSHYKPESANLDGSPNLVQKQSNNDLQTTAFKSSEIDYADDNYNLKEMLREELIHIGQKLNSENFSSDFHL